MERSGSGLRVDASHSDLVSNLSGTGVILPGIAGFSHPLPSPADPRAEITCDAEVATDSPVERDVNPLKSEHLDDLILQLQRWATRLDSREATLNAREAMLEHRERVARTVSTSLRRELEEQLVAAKAERERIRQDLRPQLLNEATQAHLGRQRH